MRLLVWVAAAMVLSACGLAAGAGAGVPAAIPSPAERTIAWGAPQLTLRDPTTAARAWQVATAVTRPGGVVVIGIDDIALDVRDHRAVPGTRALAREAVAWGRTVLYLTTNPDAAGVRIELARAGFPGGPIWTPATAPWCGRGLSDVRFRAGCIAYESRRRDVILWLTRGRQLPTAADRTFAFPG